MCQDATDLHRGQCFAGGSAPTWLDLAPRFGMVYDMHGDGRTGAEIAANRYWPAIGTGLSGNVNPIRLSTILARGPTQRRFDPAARASSVLPPATTSARPTVSIRICKRPYANEFNVEIERQLPGNIVVAAGYFHRDRKRNIGRRNIAIPRKSYTPDHR